MFTACFFWSVFSCIQTEYGELWIKSQHSVQISENTDQKKLRIWAIFTQWLFKEIHSDKIWLNQLFLKSIYTQINFSNKYSSMMFCLAFYIPHSIWCNTGSIVWKRSVSNRSTSNLKWCPSFSKRFSFYRKLVSKLTYWKQ